MQRLVNLFAYARELQPLVKGRSGRRMARIEVPAMGPFMGAMTMNAGRLGVLLLVNRPPDDDLLLVPHPAFLPTVCRSEAPSMSL